jgi:hypothetical protein
MKRVEVYYERLLKLANSLQHKTTNNFLTTTFKSKLQPYLHVGKEKLCSNIRKQHWFVKKEFLT